MTSDRFHDPDPPVAGEAERQAVRDRADRIRRRQRRQQRLLLVLPTVVVLGALAAVVVPLAGLHSTPTTTPTPRGTGSTPTHLVAACAHQRRLVVFDGNGLRFDHPSCWSARRYEDMTSFSNTVVDVSNQPMHDPCTTTKSPASHPVPGLSRTTVCRLPLTHLAPGGILVLWSDDGAPLWSLDNQPGSSLTIGGLPARQLISRPGSGSLCASIGAAQSIAVEASFAPNNFYSMTACLRGPDLALGRSEVMAMLASTTFPGQ